MSASPLSLYQLDLTQEGFIEDPAQKRAVEALERVYNALLKAKPVKTKRWWRKSVAQTPITGLYLWGGVGRGKTYLVDRFYDGLPLERKKRMHFHRFMRKVHADRKTFKHKADPLDLIAEQFAAQAQVLCFDEFVVNDIADAVILVKVLQGLFARGVTLIATSNVEPLLCIKEDCSASCFSQQ